MGNGEITIEPLSAKADHDPITHAAYAKEKNLYNLDGWKRFKNVIKKDKKLSRAIKQSKIRQVRHSQKYMFGYLIPRSYTEALEFDNTNSNSKWYDATRTEMDPSIHILYSRNMRSRSLIDTGKTSTHHQATRKFRVHLIFAVKYAGRQKARLVADGHLTPDPVESIYSGVLS